MLYSLPLLCSQLYRSSSSHSLPKGGAVEEVYGEYAASDSDVVELNDKVSVGLVVRCQILFNIPC